MKKSIPFIIGILWLMAIAVIAFYDGISFSHRESMNLCQDGLAAEGHYYIMDNRESESVVYQIEQDYSVSQIFFTDDYKEYVTISQIAYYDSLFVLLQEEERGYRIIELNDVMQVVSQSGLLSLKEKGSISGFAADEKGFYLTLIGEDRETVFTYFLEKEGSLKELPSKEEAKQTQKEEINEEE